MYGIARYGGISIYFFDHTRLFEFLQACLGFAFAGYFSDTPRKGASQIVSVPLPDLSQQPEGSLTLGDPAHP